MRRAGHVLRADPSRVVSRLFLPGQEILTHGISRDDPVIHHVLAMTEHRLPRGNISRERRALIGAYFTQEYSIEAAALFNPFVVAHPDQNALAAGELRFILSARAVGEGHISSVEFRTGVFDPQTGVRVDIPDRHLVTGHATPATLSRTFLRQALSELVGHAEAARSYYLLSLRPSEFDAGQLDKAVARRLTMQIVGLPSMHALPSGSSGG